MLCCFVPLGTAVGGDCSLLVGNAAMYRGARNGTELTVEMFRFLAWRWICAGGKGPLVFWCAGKMQMAAVHVKRFHHVHMESRGEN